MTPLCAGSENDKARFARAPKMTRPALRGPCGTPFQGACAVATAQPGQRPVQLNVRQIIQSIQFLLRTIHL